MDPERKAEHARRRRGYHGPERYQTAQEILRDAEYVVIAAGGGTPAHPLP